MIRARGGGVIEGMHVLIGSQKPCVLNRNFHYRLQPSQQRTTRGLRMQPAAGPQLERATERRPLCQSRTPRVVGITSEEL